MSEVAVASQKDVVERIGAPLVRGSWGLLALVGLALGRGLEDRSTAVKVVGTAQFWLVWGLGLVAVLVWHPLGLVLLRCASPAALAAALWAWRQSAVPTWLGVLGIAVAAIAFVVMQWSETGHLCVNGPAYPNERRFLLRPSAALLLGPIPLSGLVVAAVPIAGPLLLAARQYVLGAVLLIVGLALGQILTKALLAQARRFVVFVPAGFVVHDEFVLREPVLFLRRFLERIQAAPEDTDSLDLTNTASGLVIEVLLTEKVEIVKIVDRTKSESGSTARFLIVPTLPGRLLSEARSRRLPAG